MSIASEITRISGNIAAAYTALDGKGATLPETQNSANLADTIDSITTGGGGGGTPVYRGGWQVPDLYLQIDAIVADYPNNSSQFVNTPTKTVTHVVGMVFTPDVESVSIPIAESYIAPDDATITTTSSYTNIAFSTANRWVVIRRTTNSLSYSLSLVNGYNLNSTAKEQFYAYITYNALNNQYPDYPTTCAKRLEDVHITGTYTKNSVAISIDSILQNRHWKNPYWVLDMYSSYNESYLAESIADSSAYKNQFCELYAYPFILDFSSHTGTSKITLGRNEGYAAVNLKHLKMKLPSTCNVELKGNASTYGNPLLDLESYRYIATNAPTVSSKTFTIGTIAVNMLNTIDSTIITTLTNKGWTVN